MHDISWEDISNQYLMQMYIHNILADEYKKQGLVYGGRTYYANYNEKTGTVYGSGFIQNGVTETAQMGVNGNYLPLVKSIHQKVLNNIFSKVVKVVNKRAFDKFEKITINKDGISSMIKPADELVYDLKRVRNWSKTVKHTIDNLEKQQKKSINKSGNNKPMLSMKQLVKIGMAILGRSTELCPIETGFLRSQGHLYVHTDSIKIIYECPYAAYVENNPNAQHPIGQWKYLETAAQEILRNRSVWTESDDNYVMGKYMKLQWEHDEHGRAFGDPKWVLHTGYNTVFITIDRQLNVNYTH